MERALDLLGSLPGTASNHAIYRLKANIGIAHTRLGNDPEGARWLLDAFEAHPGDLKAIANKVLAHLLLDQNEQALQTGHTALAADPSNELAAFYLIQAAARLPEQTDPLAATPPALTNRADILLAQMIFHRKRDNRIWIAKAQQARTRFPDHKRIAAWAAEADIAEAVQAASITTYRLPGHLKSTLQQAAQLLTDAWDHFLSTGQQPGPEQFAPASSAMIAWKLSGRPSKAATIAAQLVEQKVQDRHALFNAAQILHEAGQDDLVQQALDLAPDTPDFAFVCAMRLVEQGNWDDAIAIIKSVEIPEVERDFANAFISLAPYRNPSQPVNADQLRQAMPARPHPIHAPWCYSHELHGSVALRSSPTRLSPPRGKPSPLRATWRSGSWRPLTPLTRMTLPPSSSFSRIIFRSTNPP